MAGPYNFESQKVSARNLVLTANKQATANTAVASTDMLRRQKFDGSAVFELKQTRYSDKNLSGKGTEFATQGLVTAWETSGGFKGDLDDYMAGWILAFLLGKLHFEREFGNLKATQAGGDWRITAEPKTDDLPYRAVEFVVAQDGRIEEVKVTSYDQAVLDFHFNQEKVDPPLSAGLFQFQLPAGAQLTEGDQ